jgi:hypothetical protein
MYTNGRDVDAINKDASTRRIHLKIYEMRQDK